LPGRRPPNMGGAEVGFFPILVLPFPSNSPHGGPPLWGRRAERTNNGQIMDNRKQNRKLCASEVHAMYPRGVGVGSGRNSDFVLGSHTRTADTTDNNGQKLFKLSSATPLA